jgi:hypothetical protein
VIEMVMDMDCPGDIQASAIHINSELFPQFET